MAGKTTTTVKKPAKKTTEKPRQTVKKTAEKPRKTEKKNKPTAIDFCGVKLTALRRDFIIYYVTPGQSCFHNALQAALKAGYKESTAKTDIYEILREPDIQKIIQKNESMAYAAIHESALRALELKQQRAFFDPADYFEEKEITLTNKEGEEYTKPVMALKPLQEMTILQRMCIDGIDIKGQSSTPVYLMADREKELNDIIRIDNELSKSAGGVDGEETREIIMERVTIRETKRARREAVEYEIVDTPAGQEAF